MNITLSKVKVHDGLSEETLCFEAEVLLDGKPVGHASNRGTGGGNDYRWADREVGMKLHAWAEALPPVQYQGVPLPSDLDLVISDLIQKHEEIKTLRRWCKTKTVFRLAGSKDGEWMTLKTPFNPEVKAKLVAKYGDKIAVIANELPEVCAK